MKSNLPFVSLARWLMLSAVVVVFDQVTKWLAVQHLPYGIPQPITSFFHLTQVHNYGAAWSFLADQSGWQRWLLSGVSLIACVVFIIWLYRLKPQEKLCALGLSLLLGGAAGNLLDRVFLGYVVDFLDFDLGLYRWPAFNVADIAICCGVVGLLLAELFQQKQEKK